MKIFDWLKGQFSKRSKATVAYKLGMKKAQLHDHEGALQQYTTAIAMPGAPPDILAMALYNRALVLATQGDAASATRDLNSILAMKQDLTQIKMEARRKLVRMRRSSTRPNQ